jgi:hypothetical protein
LLLFLYTGNYDEHKAPDWALQKQSLVGVTQSPNSNEDDDTLFSMTDSQKESEVTDSTNLAVGKKQADTPKEDPKGPPKTIEINILVYCAADKFNIQPLKQLAQKRFKDCISVPLGLESLTEAALMVFRKTAAGDSGLRLELVQWCLEHGTQGADRLEELLLANEPVAHSVTLKLTKKLEMAGIQLTELRAQIENLDRSCKTSEMTLKTAEKALAAAQAKDAEFRKDLYETVRKFNSRGYCHSCGFRFEKVGFDLPSKMQSNQAIYKLSYKCPKCRLEQ